MKSFNVINTFENKHFSLILTSLVVKNNGTHFLKSLIIICFSRFLMGGQLLLHEAVYLFNTPRI